MVLTSNFKLIVYFKQKPQKINAILGYHFIEFGINFSKHRDELGCGLWDVTDDDDVFEDSVKQHRDSIHIDRKISTLSQVII